MKWAGAIGLGVLLSVGVAFAQLPIDPGSVKDPGKMFDPGSQKKPGEMDVPAGQTAGNGVQFCRTTAAISARSPRSGVMVCE